MRAIQATAAKRGVAGVALLCCAVWVLALQAQTQPLEVRGIVVEETTQDPIPSAEVVLSEFRTVDGAIQPVMVGTVRTDSRGEFLFRPSNVGHFFLEARKEGYNDPGVRGGVGSPAAETPVELTDSVRLFITRFRLAQPGELTGTVIDEVGEPFAGLELKILEVPRSRLNRGFAPKVVTGEDGSFAVEDLKPADYLVMSGPPDAEFFMPPTDKDPDMIDEGIETAYFPGGNSDPALALPLRVVPGAHASVGTIRVRRKVAYPRVSVELAGECQANLNSFLTPRVEGVLAAGWACGEPQIWRYVPPGNHYTGGSNQTHWGVSQFVMGDRPVKVVVQLQRAVDIAGTVVSADGSRPQVRPAGLAIQLTATAEQLARETSASSDTDGHFVLKAVPWPEHFVAVTPMNGAAIAEIRYGGIPLRSPRVMVSAGAQFEIRLDDQPASVAGVVKNAADKPVVVIARWPLGDPLLRVAAAPPFVYITDANQAGAYRVMGMAQGEYQVVAIPQREFLRITPAELERRLGLGERMTLARGENKVLDLER